MTSDWPSHLLRYGTVVQLKNRSNGKPPTYRFQGSICGWYYNSVSDEHGYAINSINELGCIQIFPSNRVEVVS